MIKTNSFRTECICNASQKTVFQTLPHVKVTISDIKHLKYSTKSMKLDDKINYFYSNGVDYTNVCKYYDYILMLNKLVKQDENKKNLFFDIKNNLAFMYSFVFETN